MASGRSSATVSAPAAASRKVCRMSKSPERRTSSASRAKLHAAKTTTGRTKNRSEEHTSELQSRLHLVCRLLLEKKKKNKHKNLHDKQKKVEHGRCIVTQHQQ